MAKTYSEKLRDPRWQKLRLLKLEDAEWRCAECSDTETELHVHHKVYRKGADPWNYELSDLDVLCRPCHAKHHVARERLNDAAAKLDQYEYEILIGFAEALAGWALSEPIRIDSSDPWLAGLCSMWRMSRDEVRDIVSEHGESLYYRGEVPPNHREGR